MGWIDQAQVRAQASAPNWQKSVQQVGDLLVQAGFATAGYVRAMRRLCEELGPYIVLAPGIALPHARPEDGCLETGFAALTLKEPVEFGHQHNDPVSLVIAFSAKDQSTHIGALAQLAGQLSQQGFLDRALTAKTDEDLTRILNGDA